MNQSIPEVIIGGPTTAPTLAPVPTPEPSPASLSPEERFGAERKWIEHVGKALALLPDLKSSDLTVSRMAVIREKTAAARAQYNRLPVPPRLSTADTFFRKSFDEIDIAWSLVQRGIKTNDSTWHQKALAHLNTGKSFSDKGFDSLDSFVQTMRQ
ncbi:MAG: hypothetical protein KY445_16920 [Armatimonadetes bacterium]|nr:hypothetical protein [Armatimonadota bacterium]